MYEHIIVPIDGSQHALLALQHAIRLAQNETSCSITLLHINPHLSINEVAIGVDLIALQEEEGRLILSDAEKLIAGSTIPYQAVCYTGDPAQLIVNKAKEESADLIVMGSRGLSLFSELFIGSVSHKVVQHAHCAVMIVK
ncbi:universal stress protein [Paenibacillus guangzhouensis]|uniref:universal stress protein n=1 Tax=Paenibacillus guangzhouensis TaxID=1473112 RepID=UPI001266E449|nr:universal stress protein [Paenibacillus guangzhouensis]